MSLGVAQPRVDGGIDFRECFSDIGRKMGVNIFPYKHLAVRVIPPNHFMHSSDLPDTWILPSSTKAETLKTVERVASPICGAGSKPSPH